MRSLSLLCGSLAGCYGGDFFYTETDPGRVPGVTIRAPRDRSTFTEGEIIAFEGRIFDPDGRYDLMTYEWTSDRDGVLASLDDTPLETAGDALTWRLLSVGTHLVTLRAEDWSGLQGKDAITVTVAPAD